MYKRGVFSGVGSFIALLAGRKITTLEKQQIQFKPFGDGQKSFAEHYKNFILPKVYQFEERRLNALKTLRMRCFLLLPISFAILVLTAVLLSLATSFGRDGVQSWILYLAVILFGLAFGWAHTPIRKYQSLVKSEIFPYIFNFFGEFQYREASDFPLSSVMPFDIVPSYDNAHLEDSVKGIYKDVTLHLTEVQLTQEKGSAKNRRTITVFKGILILLSMNKPFLGKTIVRTDAGMIGNLLGGMFEKLQRVKLEDPVFENKFEVSATDQIEARYLLSTSFMDRLLKLAELFEHAKIQCSFFENSLFMMIPSSRNYFEMSSIFTPATFEEDINTIIEEMNLIFQIIDILKLNQKNRL